ncbi:GNAT family N-acetyltransferase [Motiliproteus coralliicola]|uniref:GNAT family N-acetyltransferase n=1 Tax=Motiliproteus coralliicola TaxID=2283196 RepID=A0A369WC36_9GAMM|nr:GNAT family N-acetyltransferase [Motiliproteus coralliicola]RDE19578.1 GNAT family N-acetyltransferase [Motiliproteus coralliicola]
MIENNPPRHRPPKLRIRLASPKDAAEIKRVAAALGYPDDSDSIARARLLTLLNSPSDQVWVCEQDGSVMGWIHAFVAHRLASDSFVEIGGLAVEPNSRRLGAGSALVQQARLWATELGMGLRVRCRIDRDGAHQFYAAQGLQPGKQQQVFDSLEPDNQSSTRSSTEQLDR